MGDHENEKDARQKMRSNRLMKSSLTSVSIPRVKQDMIKATREILDPNNDWDTKECASLSDLGGSGQGSTNLIAKMVGVGTEADGRIDVKFIDEMNVETVVKVDVCFEDVLAVGKVFVLHRVMSAGGVAVLSANGTLTQVLSTRLKLARDSLKFRLAMCQYVSDQHGSDLR